MSFIMFTCVAIFTYLNTYSYIYSSQLLSDLELLQKRMKAELQESTAVFQRQLSDYEHTHNVLQQKAQSIMQIHATTKDHDTIKLTEAVKQAKDRLVGWLVD